MLKEITIENYLPEVGHEESRREIIAGLVSPNKYIPPKYFYDTTGSELFEEITQLDEYYPTRTEKLILSGLLDVLNIDLDGLNIIELGSGDPSKITLLFSQIPEETLRTINYYPVDICESEIVKSVESLTQRFPLNDICGIVADFHHQLHTIPKHGNRLFCFFGSTIGNFTTDESEQFLTRLSAVMNPGDQILLGVDLVKDIDTIERAYNDARGITAQFNLNILRAVNRQIGTNFRCEDFEHLAFYNPVQNRIEMHLRALRDVTTTTSTPGFVIRIRKGETIHTENSHKFTYEKIKQLCAWGRFNYYQVCQDPQKWFGVVYGVR